MSAVPVVSGKTRVPLVVLLVGLLLATLASTVVGARPAAAASTVPPGFQDTAVLTGLTQPTNVAFAADGRVFVAEKSGLVKVFDGLADPTPTVFADLRTEVHNFWDRGLLGLAARPRVPGPPVRLRLYTSTPPPGGTAPSGGRLGRRRTLPEPAGRDRPGLRGQRPAVAGSPATATP